uniref:hypothetical protein n=1 Tax=Alloprevotella sp. TaxID=1872471 RepID=UPI0040296434
MKLLRYFLPVLLAVFTFCACDDWFGGDDPSDKEPQFSDYFKMEITRCERVADVLIVDFKMKNVSGKDLQQVELSESNNFIGSKDNLGNEYYNRQDVSLGGRWSKSGQKSIKKNETITGSFRIRGFDKTNSAQKLTLNFRCASSDLNFNSEVSIANIKIADKRVLTDGIDTNDFGLKYQLVGTERKIVDGRNCSFITFTVTNNTGVNLSNVDFDTDSNYFSGDTESFRYDISSEGSAFSYSTALRIQTGETKTLTIRVNGVPDRIKQLRGTVTCRTDSYILCSEDVNFYDMTFE